MRKIIATTFLTICATYPLLGEDNLMKNRGFEQGEQHWEMKDWARNRILSVSDDPDNHFARFQQAEQGLTLIEQKVEVPTGVSEITIMDRLRGRDIQTAGSYSGSLFNQETKEGVEQSRTLAVPDNTRYLLVRPGLYNASGLFDIDDIRAVATERDGKRIPLTSAKPASPISEAAQAKGAAEPPLAVRKPRTAEHELPMLDPVQPVEGARLDTAAFDTTLRVDPSNARAYTTIGAAIQQAIRNRKEGHSTRIIIARGTYREADESLFILNQPGTAVIAIEAETPGRVIITGSEIYTGWQREGAVYTHVWDYAWGVNRHWWTKYGVQIAPLGLRRENIWINGERQRQVIERDQLQPGTFYVDEGAKQLVLLPREGVDPRGATVEVATKTYGMALVKTRNVIVRGLTFQHFANTIGLREGVRIRWDVNAGGNAVQVSGSKDILVEDVTSTQNNDLGISITNNEAVTLRRVRASENGGGGFGGGNLVNVRFEDCAANRNNWRGHMVGYNGWSMGGVKVTGLDGVTFINFEARDNLSAGLWFDIYGQNVLIKGLTSTGNLDAGAYIEMQQGPIQMIDSVLENNGMGLLLSGAANFTLERTRIIGNGTQITMRNDRRVIPVNFLLRDNVIASRSDTLTDFREAKPKGVTDASGVTRIPSYQYYIAPYKGFEPQSQPLFMPAGVRAWGTFLQTLQAEGNTWYHPTLRHAFFDADRFPIDFDAWVALTKDTKAKWRNPVGKTADFHSRNDAISGIAKPGVVIRK